MTRKYKPYKARIQHKCGVPEPSYEDSIILSQGDCYGRYGGIHNFTKDIHGDVIVLQCDKAFVTYRVLMSKRGVFFAARRSHTSCFKTSPKTKEHEHLLLHFGY